MDLEYQAQSQLDRQDIALLFVAAVLAIVLISTSLWIGLR